MVITIHSQKQFVINHLHKMNQIISSIFIIIVVIASLKIIMEIVSFIMTDTIIAIIALLISLLILGSINTNRSR